MSNSSKTSSIGRLCKNAIIYGLGNVGSQFLAIFTLPLFTAHLTTAEYGVIGIISMILMLTVAVCSIGIGASMGICYFQEKGDKPARVILSSAFFLLLISSAFLLFVTLPFAGTFSKQLFGTDSYGEILRIALVSAAIISLTQPFKLTLQFEERARTFVLLSLATSLVSLGTSAYLVITLEKGVLGWIVGMAIGNLFALFFFSVATKLYFAPKVDKVTIRKLLQIGVPFLPSSFILLGLAQGNRLILERLAGMETVGIYTVGYNVGQAMNLFMAAFTTAWFPFFMARLSTLPENLQLFRRILKGYVVTGGAIVLLFFTFARPVVALLTDQSFHDAQHVVGFSALSVYFSGLFSIFLPGMYAALETHYISLLQTLALAFSIGLNFLLISAFDPILGASLALSLSYLCLVAIQFLWNKFRRYPDYSLDASSLLRISVFAAVVIAFSFRQTDETFSQAVILSIATAFFVVIFAFFSYSRSERKEIWQLIVRTVPKSAFAILRKHARL